MARGYDMRDGEACFAYPNAEEAKAAAYRVYSEADIAEVRFTEEPDGTALVRVPPAYAERVAGLLG